MAHALIERLLNKRKIKLVDLDPDEKKDFERWQDILSEEVTVESITKFCAMQRDTIEQQFGNLDNTPEKNSRLALLHSVYSKIEKVSAGEGTEKASLVRYLTDLIDKD